MLPRRSQHYYVSKTVPVHIIISIITTGDSYPNIVHSLDVWHKSKKLRKTLAKVNF